MEKYYLGFSLFPGIGSVLLSKLLEKFGSVEKAWHASKEDIQKVVGPLTGEKFVAFREAVDLETELQTCVQKGVQLVTLENKQYPTILKELNDQGSVINDQETQSRSIKMPFLLYVKGDMSILSSPKTIGIVGTRKMTSYGKQVTEMLTADLVAAGFVTVSGLALGVDACAHMATVVTGGKTVAVLGCGVDCCYPRENQKIYDEILARGGAIISHFPVGMGATVGSFPARNALIAGLSQAVVITEGAVDSGSLITAEYAKKFSRPLFAVPGPITSNLSKGSNSLLKNGAVPVTSAQDILDSLGIMVVQKRQDIKGASVKGETKEEQKILDLLQNSPLHFDEIVRKMKKDSKTVGSLLSLLELKGAIRSSADGSYSL